MVKEVTNEKEIEMLPNLTFVFRIASGVFYAFAK